MNRDEKAPLQLLIEATLLALAEYDLTSDHIRHPNGSADDCVRCKLEAALPTRALRGSVRGRR